MSKSVTLKINHCRRCPHLEIGASYSLDGFDRGNDWRCKLADKEIAGFVERPSEADRIQIPGFCPLKRKPKARAPLGG